MSGNWCTIESDPGVFTELIEQFGVEGVQVEELYSVDQAEFERVGKIYGLIFLFKWQQEPDEREALDPSSVPGVFFANQVINNACATQAILSVLLNSESIEIGNTLREFKEFTDSFPADARGLAISNSDVIREAHNSFSRNDPFVMEESRPATQDDDVFHFIAYVPVQGNIYELDGLKSGPIWLGDAGDDWLANVRPEIEARMARYSQGEIRFNLLAITRSKLLDCQERIASLEQQLQETEGSLAMATDDAELQARKVDLEHQLQEARRDLQDEERRREQYKAENVRRRHNYIPFAVSLFKHLAQAGLLRGMVTRAEERQQQQQQQQADAKSKGEK